MAYAELPGKSYDGVDLSIQLFGFDITGFKGIDVKEAITSQNNHGKGKRPRGYSRGKIDYTGSISLYAEALQDIKDVTPVNSSILDIPPFPIILKMDNGTGRIITTKVMAMFNESPSGGKTDDLGIYYDIPLHVISVK